MHQNGNPSLARSHDVVVIGGGPAGAAVATLLAQRGIDVAVVERHSFPRFHVGESLVPAVNLSLARLGVLDRMDAHGFPHKHAVQFFSPRGPGKPFYFAEVADPRMRQTWQVLRSDFDAMLLGRAVECGARVATECEVREVLTEGGSVVGVRLERDGGMLDVATRLVIDASGQKGLLAARQGKREHIPGLENTSVFAHFENERRDPGQDAGSTLIYRLDHKSWLWWIPLPNAVSIGLVAPAKEIAQFGNSPTEMLENAIAMDSDLSGRLSKARRINEVRAVRDFSYRARVDGGRGWALVGDALAFIDPIYSTGLFLAMHSAELCADAAATALAKPDRPDLAGFATDYRRAFGQFLALVRAYYTEDFHFGEFSKQPEHRQGLVDLLTGIVDTPQAHGVADAIRARMGAASGT